MGSAWGQSDEEPFAKWEKAIAKFEQLDREQGIGPGGVVFVGSSSIRMWDLGKSFPERGKMNRDAKWFESAICDPPKPRFT